MMDITTTIRGSVLCASLALGTAVGATAQQTVPLFGGAQTRIEPPEAVDINPAPNVVEVILRAKPASVDLGTGNMVSVYAYNGSIPGPTIKANVGDHLIVHFINNLPEDSTIHWHGMPVPANMDGSHISQLTVPPGGTFKYEFDLLEAAIFWYHPHVRTSEQVEKGLYGVILVDDPAANLALGLPTVEHILVLDDVLLDSTGQIADPLPVDPLENADMQLNGREGNVLLVNGQAAPFKPTVKFQVGVPQRLRIVNVANSRFMRLSIPDHTMYRIGGGQGLLETPQAIPEILTVPDSLKPGTRSMSDPDLDKGILLSSAERADIVFTPNTKKPIKLEWHDVHRGRHVNYYDLNGNILPGHFDDDGRQPSQEMMRVKTAGGPPSGEWVPPANLRTINPIDTTNAKVLASHLGHTYADANGDVTFFIQLVGGSGTPFNLITPADAQSLNVGDVAVWAVHNMTGGIHNFHLHGFKFQHLDTQWIDLENPSNNYTIPAKHREWMDTIQLPPRPGLKGLGRTITRIAVEIDDTGRVGQIEASNKVPTATTSGGWLFHCHILEHSAKGMMSFLQVFP